MPIFIGGGWRSGVSTKIQAPESVALLKQDSKKIAGGTISFLDQKAVALLAAETPLETGTKLRTSEI
jgi:hypothetical protein